MFNCDKCKDEQVDSAVYFKIRFRVLDINTKKDCCGTSRLMKSAYVPLPLLDMSKFK